MRSMTTRWALAAAVLGMMAVGRVEASFLILDTPNAILARPLTGSITYTFTGSASFDVGYTAFAHEELLFPRTAAGNALSGAFGAFPSAAYNGGVYTGALFTITVTSTAALGLYNVNPLSPDGLPIFSLEASTVGSNYSNETIQADYNVTVVPAAAIPEPASVALMGIGLAGTGLAGWRRSRRRGGRGTIAAS